MKRERKIWPEGYQPRNGNSAPVTSSSISNKHPGGRPPVYNDTMPDRAYKLIVRNGLSQTDLAIAFGVTEGLISQWKDEHPEFLKMIKRGWEDFATGEIRKSLALRAKGYKTTEKVIEPVKILDAEGKPTGKTRLVVTKIVRKEFAGETAASIFWLVNWSRRNGNTEWMQTNKIEVSGKLQTEETGPASKALAEILKASSIDNIRLFRDSVKQIAEGANGHCSS